MFEQHCVQRSGVYMNSIGINQLYPSLLAEGVNTIVENQWQSWPPTIPKLAPLTPCCVRLITYTSYGLVSKDKIVNN